MAAELTSPQITELHHDLDTLELALKQLLEDTEAGSKPVKLKDNAGRLSRMDEMHNQSILIANRNVTKNRLRHVKIARQRMRDELYGLCLSCEEPIAFQRLKAYPEASLCIDCKSADESS